MPAMGAMAGADSYEEAGLSRAMLSKLSKQQHLLQRELERTKCRLREEIWARERRIATTAKANELPEGVVGGPRIEVACLKRSRSEAGMSSIESDAEDGERARVLELEAPKPTPSTRIDMLPVLSSTGEAALEVGLSSFPVGRGWTAQPRGAQHQTVHMLPVFRLPDVSKNPVGGFLRRLPREETKRERECRLRETEELEKMKSALGLTERELEALENELLPGRDRGGQDPAVTSRPLKNIDGNGVDLEKGSHELLYNSRSQGKQDPNSTSTPSGKRRRRLADEKQGGREGRTRCKRGAHRPKSRPQDRNCSSIVYDSTVLDLPTPRVLRRTPHSTIGAELAASATLLGRCKTEHKRAGTRTSPSGIGLGAVVRPVLGTAVTTDQLVAAAAEVGMANLLELRRELGRSVGQVRCLARAVKADVQDVTRICPVQHPRAVRFLRRWACERLAILANEIIFSRAGAALERWRRAVAAMATAERKQAYLRYQGSSKLLLALDKVYLRRLAKGWIRWTSLVHAKRAEERRALEMSAATLIQQAVRGWSARRLRAWLTAVAKDRQRHLAAVSITRCAKGKVARMRYGRMRADVERARASEMIRRIGRGMLGRKKARRRREERARLKVAVSLQRLYRGRAGRRLFLSISKARRERVAATKIQAITRGMWGRQHAASLSVKIREDAAASYILRAARGWLARRQLERLREADRKFRLISSVAALTIQRVYRGHRSRVLHGARLEIKRSNQRTDDAAATKIQALVRAHLSKRIVATLSKKRKERRASDARLWAETWSEDAQAWFYYNAQTGEALWEPPSTGYTKYDGALVLASGEVIADPLLGLTEEERLEAKKQSSCVECEQKRATRKCEQCGDGYCTKCFRKTHASGRRAKHTWANVGPMECAECEAEVAIKWCTACDDPFCGPCWAAIHSRGKRSLHSHCTVSPGGRVSTKAIGPDGSDAGPFTPGDSLVAETTGGGGYEHAGGQQGYGTAVAAAPLVEVDSAVSDWQEFADDDGYPYWYNSSTGSSQYENPHVPAWTGGSAATATSTVTYSAGVDNAWEGTEWGTAQQGESTYVDPLSGAIVPAAEGSGAGEWSEHLDDEGYTYFYSSTTGESQYESPYP